ncbi:hypothetical protein RF11_01653 [Thelohanellus kitauei]|uniref:Uncharacterized protein n=1 Tax=Thelohanellus kitauei TaxID=669202 RepID=A0A0C2JLC8_THEKT|nr:hypothetical protein RF11_01653 [Thelohanellus kitauei]
MYAETRCLPSNTAESRPARTHFGNGSQALARTTVGQMKERLAEEIATPNSVQVSVMVTLDKHVLVALPKRSTLNQSLRRSLNSSLPNEKYFEFQKAYSEDRPLKGENLRGICADEIDSKNPLILFFMWNIDLVQEYLELVSRSGSFCTTIFAVSGPLIILNFWCKVLVKRYLDSHTIFKRQTIKNYQFAKTQAINNGDLDNFNRLNKEEAYYRIKSLVPGLKVIDLVTENFTDSRANIPYCVAKTVD